MIRATAALCMVFLFCASYSVYLSQWQATVIGFHQWLWRDCHVYILEHTSTPVRIRNLSREPSRGSSLPTSLLSHPFLLYFLFTQQVSLVLRSCRHHSLLTGGYSHFTDARWLRYLQQKKITGDETSCSHCLLPYVLQSTSPTAPSKDTVSDPGCFTVAHWLGKSLVSDWHMGRPKESKWITQRVRKREEKWKIVGKWRGWRVEECLFELLMIKCDRRVGSEGQWWWTMVEIKGKRKEQQKKKWKKGQGEQRRQGVVCCQIW